MLDLLKIVAKKYIMIRLSCLLLAYFVVILSYMQVCGANTTVKPSGEFLKPHQRVDATLIIQNLIAAFYSVCEGNDANCSSCLQNVNCLWCNNPKKCIDYPVHHVLPTSDDCPLAAARWGVCWCK